MSVVINYVSQFISIIATDTRISWGKHAEYGYTDDNDKLYNLPNMGWCAGVGLHSFLENFKQDIGAVDITDPKQIEQIFERSIERTHEESPQEWRGDIDKSVVASSWLGATESEIFFRIGIMSKEHFGYQLRVINHESIQILYPIEYVDDPSKVKILESKIDLTQHYNFDLHSLLLKIYTVFKEVSKGVISVSDTCDVGIHLIDNQGIYRFRIRGQIDSLINDLHNGMLNLQVIDVAKFDEENSVNPG